MATISKKCPTCGGKRPVTLTIGPTEQGSQTVVYVATCKGCGYVHPPDTATVATKIVGDAKTWAASEDGAAAIAALGEKEALRASRCPEPRAGTWRPARRPGPLGTSGGCGGSQPPQS